MKLNIREKAILDIIISSQAPASVTDMSSMLNISKRSVYYSLAEINKWLKSVNIDEVQSVYGLGYYFSLSQIESIKESNTINELQDVSQYYQFLKQERIDIIVLSLAIQNEIITIDDLMQYCNVSRNTIISDLNVVREILDEFEIELQGERSKGWWISANAIQSRSLFLFHFEKIRHLYHQGLVSFISKESSDKYRSLLLKVESELNTKYVGGMLESLAVLLSLKEHDTSELDLFTTFVISDIQKTKEYCLVSKYLPALTEFNKTYLTLHFRGGRVRIKPEVSDVNLGNDTLRLVCEKIVDSFEAFACIKYHDTKAVVQAILSHVESSIFRYKFGIDIGNPMVDTIKTKYKYLFEITKLVIKDLNKLLKIPTSDNEIAYLTVIFGSFMDNNQFTQQTRIVQVVSFDGVALQKILENDLKSLLPDTVLIFVKSLDDLKPSDLVISTIHINKHLNYLKINPILTEDDKRNIVRRIYRNYVGQDSNMLLELVLDKAKQYVESEYHTKLQTDLKEVFQTYSKLGSNFTTSNPSIKEVLTLESTKFVEDQMDWVSAIQRASNPLLKKGSITQDYVDKITQTILEKGPYMYFSPGIIIAHARPEDGVRELSISFTLFKDSIMFGSDCNARIVICLAPIDYHRHLKIINEIIFLFDSNDFYNQLIELNDEKKIYELIRETIKRKE